MDSKDEYIAVLEARTRDLEMALKQNNQDIMLTFKLTPALSNIFGLLMTMQLVTPDIIQQRLEIVTDAKVAMHRLRQHMKQYGISIESKRKLGYWLEADVKELARKKMAGDETPAGNSEDSSLVTA